MDGYVVITDIEKAYNELLSHGHLTDINREEKFQIRLKKVHSRP